MMALVPSNNGESDNRTAHNEKNRNDGINRNSISSLSVNQFNARPSQDRTTYEQVYQIQQSRNRTSSDSNRQRRADGKTFVVIDTSYDNHPPENSAIQLPLIETHHSRPVSRNSISRKRSEPLGVLPLKHRHNLRNHRIPTSSEDAKQELLRLAVCDPTASNVHSTLSRTYDSMQRIRTYNRDDYDEDAHRYESKTNMDMKKSNYGSKKCTPERLNSAYRFLGYNGKERAAIVIQSYWRGFCIRRVYKKFKKRKWAVRVITSAWLTYSRRSQIRHRLKQTCQRQLEFFHRKQNELYENWPSMVSNRRTIVHLPSLGLTQSTRRSLTDLSLRESYQIGRLCELEDPNVDVIYVSPVDVTKEILQYYDKLINLRAMVEQGSEQPIFSTSNNVNERFKIIVPEALHSFPKHNMCLATLLKYSPKALKQIKNLIKDRPCYLVSGVSHIDDLYIAEYLDIPIYGCEPEASYLYSTKSGSKRIFKSSNVPLPFSEYDIYDEKHLLNGLAQLILDHLDIQRWLFKVDDHFDGLGVAYCDIATHLPCYQNVVKEAEKLRENWSIKSVQKDYYRRILSELPDVLHKHTVYINKAQFNSWKSYLSVFLTQGGIIEAYPPSDSITSLTISLAIEFNGQYSLICAGDQLHAESQFSCWGLVFPQTSVDPKELNGYCALIAEQCKQRHIYGYVDIDLVTFIDAETDKQHLWVTDLSIGYSEHVSLFRVMKYITTGQFNSQSHSFTVQMKQPKQRLRNWQNGAPEYLISERNRFAIWSSRLYHTSLSTVHYSVFFQICRAHSVGFDVREKQGSIFTLLQGNHHDHIGMVTISETLQQTLSTFISNLNAIERELIKTTETQGQHNFKLAMNDINNILDATQDNVSNVSLNTTTS
ncbi:unnamed protein product [Adineta ricciae]|uniref:IQCH-like ATP-grasp domain-containing protein n=1 Tax=Adineta ricciae TaxID=249248 RepID=A0A815DQI0_ADIRI|nr:unnamed protein product [Adineta ricciae]